MGDDRFIICCFAAPQLTLGLYHGDSFTHPMLITAFYLCYSGRLLGGAQKQSWVPEPFSRLAVQWENILIVPEIHFHFFVGVPSVEFYAFYSVD